MSCSGKILIVEDNDDDFEACVTALTKCNSQVTAIDRCETGDEVVNYLLEIGAQRATTQCLVPVLILLDLNLPGMNGREVLALIKSYDTLSQVPVVVLSTSNYEKDIEECYKIGANSFVRKPASLDGFLSAIEMLYHYWFEFVQLPRQAK